MFVAWRDLRFAKGRFALMGAVVVLITLLVGLLSGLTAGLAEENTSAVTALPADHLAFAAPAAGQPVSFTGARVPSRARETWSGTPGVTSAEPIGIRTLNAAAGNRTAAVSAFAVRPGSGIAPAGVAPGRAVLSEKAAAALGVTPGDRVGLGGAELTVAAVAGRASYSHTPVVWTDLSGPATVIALRADGADLRAADRAAGTKTFTKGDALTAIGSYRAENGSLQLMRGFLFVISALVTGAFFTVWTIQRAPDIAVLKALGASTPYLLRDALGQAVFLLAAGTLLGTGLAAGSGALVRGGGVPFAPAGPAVLGPAAVTIALGALGAGLSVRRITAVDPLTALASAR
ncbi:ABC transporter permease [Streptomyces sp. NBC_00151]|uniref:ABC transporter permease n=1 Tax=Streptomyces sp. NBC_00151 TaxID=2975669 RepID=UPI002DD7A4FC|nr:ABC transporter permease [Streptomyces sp. NBC_00151]WRZ38623.1 ABC transporter permease [Streptomyces sp. NBC_00151]